MEILQSPPFRQQVDSFTYVREFGDIFNLSYLNQLA